MGVSLGGGRVGVSSSARHARGSARRIYRFGVFELGAETGELWKHGTRIKLQIKPLQVLEALLEKPGELISRAELCKRLWPAGTFVDFESGLNTATNRLRAALGDSAESPRYIETLPRLGYRFICPVTQIQENKPELPVPSQRPQAEILELSTIANAPEEPATPLPAASGESAAADGARFRHLRRFLRYIVVASSLVGMAVAVGYVRSRASTPRQQAAFHQLTFRTGVVGPARFAADSQSAIYTARWTNGDRATYLIPLQGSEAHPLSFARGVLAAVSKKGDLAFVNTTSAHQPAGLARVSVNGGSPQMIASDAKAADWTPDGRDLALVREHGPDSTVEFPAGHAVYTSQGWIDCLRVSPRGDRVAFLEHPVRDDTAGYVRIVDRSGRTEALTQQLSSAEGLAWSPSGNEIWFTASKNGAREVLYAVSKAAKLRQVSDTPSSLRLLDIARNGRVLLATDDTRQMMMAAFHGDKAETDLSKFDASHVDDISSDGNLVLFTESGDAAGQHYEAYLHNHKLRDTCAIGFGRGLAISADGNAVLTIDPQERDSLTLTVVASRLATKIYGGAFIYQWAKFLPGGKELLVGGSYPGGPLMLARQKIQAGKPVPLNGVPYLDYVVISPDASRIAGLDADYRAVVFEISGKAVRKNLPETAEMPVAWSRDGIHLYSVAHCDTGYRISKLNIDTGETELWKAISPAGRPGFAGLASVVAAPEAGAYAYSSNISFSRLYVVDGWS